MPAPSSPSAVVPIQFPVTALRFPFSSASPTRQRLITKPLTELEPPRSTRPSNESAGRFSPLSSMSGMPAKPPWVVASSTIGSPMAGSGNVGAIFWAPDPIEKVIWSAPGFAFDCWIAARRVHVFSVVAHAGTVRSLSPRSAFEFTT